jgi:hypothetical protein
LIYVQYSNSFSLKGFNESLMLYEIQLSQGLTMRIQQIISELKQPFAMSDHQEYVNACGDKWFYIPWQKIRDRLDHICPDWQVSYSDPIAVSGYITVRCMLTVAGLCREATGSDKAYQQLHHEANPDHAMINAFINAAGQFGIGDYLHDAQFMSGYMQRQPKLPNMIESHSIQLTTPLQVLSSAQYQAHQQAKKAEMMEVTQILRKLNKKPKSPLRIGLNFWQSAPSKPRASNTRTANKR